MFRAHGFHPFFPLLDSLERLRLASVHMLRAWLLALSRDPSSTSPLPGREDPKGGSIEDICGFVTSDVIPGREEGVAP